MNGKKMTDFQMKNIWFGEIVAWPNETKGQNLLRQKKSNVPKVKLYPDNFEITRRAGIRDRGDELF